jgi:hypothetical protein
LLAFDYKERGQQRVADMATVVGGDLFLSNFMVIVLLERANGCSAGVRLLGGCEV